MVNDPHVVTLDEILQQVFSKCHSTLGFNRSSFTIERHNNSPFQLSGGHLATPCITCHKKNDKWSFREIGLKCVDCHKDAHEPNLDKKYYKGGRFVIEVKNNSKTNIYIQSATLNGKPLNKPWFYHRQLVNGGKLVLKMGPSPNKQWGSAPEAAPPSMTK